MALASDKPKLEHAYRFLSALPNTEALLRAILEEALEVVRATRGTIALMDYRTGELVMRIAVGNGWTEERMALRLRVTDEPGGSISGYVALTGQPYLCGDVTKDPHYYPLFSRHPQRTGGAADWQGQQGAGGAECGERKTQRLHRTGRPHLDGAGIGRFLRPLVR
jgi:hypothetical protein